MGGVFNSPLRQTTSIRSKRISSTECICDKRTREKELMTGALICCVYINIKHLWFIYSMVEARDRNVSELLKLPFIGAKYLNICMKMCVRRKREFYFCEFTSKNSKCKSTNFARVACAVKKIRVSNGRAYLRVVDILFTERRKNFRSSSSTQYHPVHHPFIIPDWWARVIAQLHRHVRNGDVFFLFVDAMPVRC